MNTLAVHQLLLFYSLRLMTWNEIFWVEMLDQVNDKREEVLYGVDLPGGDNRLPTMQRVAVW